ncbi:hypothetical protein HYU23_03020 [Candidatus Woesearchaeota archaeon]|nr:hypothetical protein [Candidatus Woesearchaeota archaeon]
MFKKKSQIEMIGLVIVVIILAVGLLLYVRFAVFREETNTQDSSIELAYLTNLMSSIFNVKVCESSPIKFDEGIGVCFQDGQICGENACDYLKGQTKDILGKLNLKKYKNYSIWVTRGNENKTILAECKTGILTHTTIVMPDKSHYTAYFRVC